jgi:ATP-binding cassette, subfamily B, multidrug efflux pump
MTQEKKMGLGDLRLLETFFRFVKPHKTWVIIALLAVPFTTGASVLIPLLLVHIVDKYIVPGNLSGLYFMCFLFGCSVLMGYLADGAYSFSLQNAGQRSIADMRKALFEHTIKLPRSYFDTHPIGVTLSRLTSDMDTMGESIAASVLALFTDFFKTLSLLCFLFYLSWKLTLLIILIFPIVYLVVTFVRKRLRFYFNLSRKALAEATGYLQESLNGIKTIQLFVAENKVLERFKDKNSRFFKAQTSANTYDASLFSIIDSLTSVTMALVIWYGTGQILSGIVTIGVLIGFINTLSRIFVPIREFAQQIALIQRALSALEHVNDLFSIQPEEESESKDGKSPISMGEFKNLTFKSVTFRYINEGLPILDDLSFELVKGEKIAIVGTTGSGKSTVLKLITRAYADYSGSISINNSELAEITRTNLNQMITIMHQDTHLFNESLGFNISLGRPGINQGQIWKAATYVHANEFINDLPGKLDYQVIDNGANLSTGQAQLISYARAIAGNSELILLDEATSSVDSVTEELIQKAIDRIFTEKTVIAVAHRLSTIRKSDRILVMKQGRIVESGNHNTLIARNGYYVQLLQAMELELDSKQMNA